MRQRRPGDSEIQEVLILLADTPKLIARLARGLSDQHLHRKPHAEAWSAQEIVAHLRVCADVWGASIDRMLAEDHPTIRYVSPRGWSRKTAYLQQDFRESVREFSAARAGLVDRLRVLDAAGWSRQATFEGTTKGRDATVLTWARRIADHEVQHLDQLRRTLGGQDSR